MSEFGHANRSRGCGESFARARDVAGGVDRHAPVTALPPPVDHFTGRDAQLAELDALLHAPARGVVISAASGTAGVGTTALALHWAHRVRHLFPDGQLYADLRGHDRPLPPGDVLTGFLRAPAADDVPDDPAARYRDLVADRRVLVVLDNARTVEQVLPLLPDSPTCFVVVTSRDTLPALRARYGLHGLDLDVPPVDEALRLLRATTDDRVDREPGAAAALVRLCARLPLALRITAGVAAHRPRATLRELADELADEWRTPGATGDDRGTRAVFSWSVRQLDDDSRAVFRLLGLHPGRDCDTGAVAALADLAESRAHRALDVLARAHLVEEHVARRYRMHDLPSAHARELARDAPDAEAASRRLFRHYADTARRAARDGYDGLAWLTAEQPNLEAVVVAGGPATGHLVLHHVEALLALGQHADAARRLRELRERLPGTVPEAKLDQLAAIAALGQGDWSRAARLAGSARSAHLDRDDLREAAACALTHLAAVTTAEAAPRNLVDTALATADELTAAGLTDEAGTALLLGARLLLAHDAPDGAVDLLHADSRTAPREPSADRELLRWLCLAELAVRRAEPHTALEQVEPATTALRRAVTPPTGLTPAPMREFWARRLAEAVVPVAIEPANTRLLLDFAERTGHPHPAGTGPEVVALDVAARTVGHRALVVFTRVLDELVALVIARGQVRALDLGDARTASFDQHVMRPLREHVGELDLVIVPTGELHSTTWAALPSLRGRPVVVAPSATAWVDAETSQGAKPVGQQRVVFVIGPGTAVSPQDLTVPAAHHPHAEVIPAWRASVRAVLEAANGAGLVHIAAHGKSEAGSPSPSRLELADGPLFAHQFGELRKPPGQVVLATGAALDFAYGLLAAGVSTVIAAARQVDDRTATATLLDYHRALSAGHSPARALARAVEVDPLRRPFLCIGSGEG